MPRGYQHHLRVLDNGLKVVVVRIPHLHSATVAAYFRVGSRHETRATNGISHFLEHMMFRGCADFPDSTALNAAMEDLGGSLEGYTTRDHTGYYSSVHPECVLDATEILGAMLRAPTFRDLDIERSIILEEFLDSVDQDGLPIDLDAVAYREFFGTHPMGFPIDGSRRNIERFGLRQLRAHHRAFYGAPNAVLCFTGQVDLSTCMRAARRSFGDLPNAALPEFPEIPPHPKDGRAAAGQAPRHPGRLRYVQSDDPQSRVRISFRTVPETHPDHAALSLLRRVLDGGFSARLPVEMVEKRGIAYYIGADLEPYADCGLFQFEFAVAHSKLAYAIDELGEVILSVLRAPIPEDELRRIHKRARISVEFSLDSAVELNHWFGATQLFRDPDHPRDRIRALAAIDAADLQRVARCYFQPERMSVAAVGGADPSTVRAARRSVRRLSTALSDARSDRARPASATATST